MVQEVGPLEGRASRWGRESDQRVLFLGDLCLSLDNWRAQIGVYSNVLFYGARNALYVPFSGEIFHPRSMSHAPGMVSHMSPVDVCPPSCLPVPPWQAYLSLPEGAASAVGLIAMMTDHYARAVSRAAESIAGQP